MDDGPRFSRITVWVVRILALGIMAALLDWGGHLEDELHVRFAAEFRLDSGLFWRGQLVYLIAGVAFAVAVRFPFPRSRFAWGRLLIAGIVFLPVAHVWFYLTATSGPSFLRSIYWFDRSTALWSTLTGVAIGAGFGARRAKDDSAVE